VGRREETNEGKENNPIRRLFHLFVFFHVIHVHECGMLLYRCYFISRRQLFVSKVCVLFVVSSSLPTPRVCCFMLESSMRKKRETNPQLAKALFFVGQCLLACLLLLGRKRKTASLFMLPLFYSQHHYVVVVVFQNRTRLCFVMLLLVISMQQLHNMFLLKKALLIVLQFDFNSKEFYNFKGNFKVNCFCFPSSSSSHGFFRGRD